MRNMTKRRMLLITKSSPSILPREYREVQWLRGTGTQYCELSYNPVIYQGRYANSSIRGSIVVLNRNTSKLAILADDAYGGTVNGHTRYGIKINNGIFNFDYGFQPDGYEKSINLSDLGTDNINIDFEVNRGSRNNLILNNSSYNGYVEGNMSAFYPYLIGAYYTGLSTISVLNENTLIKKVSIYEGDELISDIIPCYRKSDGKAGFYETGSGNFIINSGTGSDWLIGPTV